MARWEPWTGCYPASDGCTYCYFYGPYSKRHGQNTITKTEEFNKPLEMKTKNKLKIESGTTVSTCFSTDFFLPEADEWRVDAWDIIRQRPDLHFMFLTKRIERFPVALPADWGEGYDNVTIGCTVENQTLADKRLPLFLSYPIRHRVLSCGPLLGELKLAPDLYGLEQVTVGGESGREARLCDFNWVLDIRAQCAAAGVAFQFKNTGSRFLKDGEVHKISSRMEHRLARETGINTLSETHAPINEEE